MKKTMIRRNLRDLLANTEGLTTVEYIIILVLIAVLAIGVWRTFGSSVRQQVSYSTGQVDGLSGSH